MFLTVHSATFDEYYTGRIPLAPGEGYNIDGSGGLWALAKEVLVVLTKLESTTYGGVEDESPSIVWAVEGVLGYLGSLNITTNRTSDIKDYLYSHPDMVNFVKRISETTRDYFGDSAYLTLELYKDPEIDDKYLTLLINDRNAPGLILDKIYKIIEGYEKDFSELSGWLMLGPDYRKAAW